MPEKGEDWVPPLRQAGFGFGGKTRLVVAESEAKSLCLPEEARSSLRLEHEGKRASGLPVLCLFRFLLAPKIGQSSDPRAWLKLENEETGLMLSQTPSSPPLGKWRALHPFNATLPRTSTINYLPIKRHPSAREGSREKHGQLLQPPNLFALEQE